MKLFGLMLRCSLVCVSLILLVTCAILWIRSVSATEEWLWSFSKYAVPSHAAQNDGVRLRIAKGDVVFMFNRTYWSHDVTEPSAYRHWKFAPSARINIRAYFLVQPGYLKTWHHFQLAWWNGGVSPSIQDVERRSKAVSDLMTQRAAITVSSDKDYQRKLILEMRAGQLLETPFPGGWGLGLCVPGWFLVAISLPLPLVQLRRALRLRYRLKHKLCVTCGYDLRETPARCPECGSDKIRPRGKVSNAQQ